LLFIFIFLLTYRPIFLQESACETKHQIGTAIRTSEKLKELSSNVFNQSSAKRLKLGGSEAVLPDTLKLDLGHVEPDNVKHSPQL